MPLIRPMSTRGIDGHAHVFARDLKTTPSARYAPDYDATLADYLALLDAHGLSHGVLVQPSFLGTDNRYLLQALAQAPSRLRGVVVVDPGIAPDQLERMAALGVKGVRLNLVGRDLPDLGDAHWQAFFKRLNALGWHVELHRRLEDLPGLLTPLLAAGCRVVVDHYGRADARLGIDQPGFQQLLAWGREGAVWVKVSALYRLTGSATEQLRFAGEALPALFEHLGEDRLLWGSDWPHTQHERHVDTGQELSKWHTLIGDGPLLARTLRDNAAELFGI
jgi:predicted TIM-barrel fold metal-dependent hydrolase